MGEGIKINFKPSKKIFKYLDENLSPLLLGLQTPLMAGEMLSATKGLGQVLTVGRDLADMSQVIAVMVVIIVLGLMVDKLIFGRLELNVRQRWGLDRA